MWQTDSILTCLSIVWHVTAAVFQVSQTTVPRQSKHDPRRTYGVDERRFFGGYESKTVTQL